MSGTPSGPVVIFEFLLHPVVIAIVILTTIAPFRWAWRWWLLIAILVAALMRLAPRIHDPGLFDLLAYAQMTVFAAVISVVLFIRRVISAALNVRSLWGVAGRIERRLLGAVDGLLAIGAGVVAAGYGTVALGWSFAAAPAGFAIHATVALIAVAASAAVVAFRSPEHWRISVFALAGLSSVLVLSIAGALYPLIVVREARSLGGADPHCLALTTRQRPVRSWQDVTFFTMDKTRFRHHAVLVVDRGGAIEPYHWSYHAGRFIPGVINWSNASRPYVACRPEAGFMGDLPIVTFKNHGYREIFVGGEPQRIPNGYRPRAFDDYLAIDAALPDFRPASRTSPKLYASMLISDDTLDAAWLQSSDIAAATPVAGVGDLAELLSADGTRIYLRSGETGEILTVIRCYAVPETEVACQHAFRRDGRGYSFRHSPEDLARSAELEQRLVETFASFASE